MMLGYEYYVSAGKKYRLDTEAKGSTGFRILKTLKDCRSHRLKCLTCLDSSIQLLSNLLYVVAQGTIVTVLS